MDEPCSALDPASTLAIEDLIDELRDQYTIVIVTHNMQQASRCSDKTAFFFEGRVIEFDTTEKSSPNLIHRRPRTMSVAASVKIRKQIYLILRQAPF